MTKESTPQKKCWVLPLSSAFFPYWAPQQQGKEEMK